MRAMLFLTVLVPPALKRVEFYQLTGPYVQVIGYGLSNQG